MRVRDTTKLGVHDRYGVDHATGEEFEIRDDIALKLVRLGRVVSAPEPVIETTEAPAPPENTAKRVGKTATRKSRAGSQKRSFSATKE